MKIKLFIKQLISTVLVFCFVIAVQAITGNLSAHALDCYVATPDETAEYSDVIVQGYITKSKSDDYYLIKVNKSWKQEIPDHIIVHLPSHWGDTYFLEQNVILFLHSNDNGTYEQNLCDPIIYQNSSFNYESDYSNTIEHLDSEYEKYKVSGKTPIGLIKSIHMLHTRNNTLELNKTDVLYKYFNM